MQGSQWTGQKNDLEQPVHGQLLILTKMAGEGDTVIKFPTYRCPSLGWEIACPGSLVKISISYLERITHQAIILPHIGRLTLSNWPQFVGRPRKFRLVVPKTGFWGRSKVWLFKGKLWRMVRQQGLGGPDPWKGLWRHQVGTMRERNKVEKSKKVGQSHRCREDKYWLICPSELTQLILHKVLNSL